MNKKKPQLQTEVSRKHHLFCHVLHWHFISFVLAPVVRVCIKNRQQQQQYESMNKKKRIQAIVVSFLVIVMP